MESKDYRAKAKEIREHIYANVGHTLCEFRKDAGYSLEEAADLIGYKPAKLLKVEEGKGRLSMPAFLRIVTTLGGHIHIEGKTGTYTLEELYQIPPITQEEIESKEITREIDKNERARNRTRDWLNKMSENWDDDSDI